MDHQRRGHNTAVLWMFILLGTAYSSLLYYRCTLTSSEKADGIVGVLLGLYICSHPAANVVDLLFFRGDAQRHFSSKWSTALWVALNVLVLVIGWIVIFIGTTRLVGRPEGISVWM
jgi:uncharacterized membrane protein YGL010W